MYIRVDGPVAHLVQNSWKAASSWRPQALKLTVTMFPTCARLSRALLCVLRAGRGLAVFLGLCGFAGLAADWAHNGNDDEQQEQQR